MSTRAPHEEAGEGRRSDWVANREALVAAATSLYAEHGLDVSFEQLAQRAGVGRATLYRHFPSREALRLAVIERIVEGIETAAAPAPDAPETFREVFTQAVRLQIETIPIAELLPHSGANGPATEQLRARVRRAFSAPLAAAQAAGEVDPGLDAEDVRLQLVMLAGVIRPETPRADRLRAWRLAESALGMRHQTA